MDGLEEVELGGKSIGTTGKGIGVCTWRSIWRCDFGFGGDSSFELSSAFGGHLNHVRQWLTRRCSQLTPRKPPGAEFESRKSSTKNHLTRGCAN